VTRTRFGSPFVLAAGFLLAAHPVLAQDKTIVGRDTILPGSGPGSSTTEQGAVGIRQAGSAADAASRTRTEPSSFLSTQLVGITVRNSGGEEVGTIKDLLLENGLTLRAVVLEVGGFLGLTSRIIAVEPSAIVLRPGGNGFSAVISLSKDVISGAPAFKFDNGASVR